MTAVPPQIRVQIRKPRLVIDLRRDLAKPDLLSAILALFLPGCRLNVAGKPLVRSSVAFTLQVYGHLLEETKKETASKMDAALWPVATTIAAKPGLVKVN